MKDYSTGFDVNGKYDIETVEWIFDENESNESKLQFLAYDANLWPLPHFSTWRNEDWKRKQMSKAYEFTKDFTGEVWLDDVLVKPSKQAHTGRDVGIVIDTSDAAECLIYAMEQAEQAAKGWEG